MGIIDILWFETEFLKLIIDVESNNFLGLYLPASFGVGIIISFYFTVNCQKYSISHYAGSLSFIGFMQAIAMIVRLSGVLVTNLSLLGTSLCIPPSVIGLTVLGFGNSLGELVTNTFVANQVSSTTAITACYGGPIMSIY